MMIFSRYLPEPVRLPPDRDSIPPPAQEFSIRNLPVVVWNRDTVGLPITDQEISPSRSPSTSIRWLGGPGRRFSLFPPSRRLRPKGGRHLRRNLPLPTPDWIWGPEGVWSFDASDITWTSVTGESMEPWDWKPQ